MNKKIKKGFTLVELLVVIAILAVLATVSVVGYTSFITKSEMSVDEQFVTQLNTYLEAAEVVDGKLATVADAQAILAENDVTVFEATHGKNDIYWVGSENRVILWTWKDKDKTEGKVSYPEKYAEDEAYRVYTTPSANWSLLRITATVVELEEATQNTVFNAIKALDEENAIVKLPENSTLVMDGVYLSAALKNSAGTNKEVTLDLNGGTYQGTANTNGFNYAPTVPTGGSLTIANGTVKIPQDKVSYAATSADSGGSLVLRDVVLESNGAAVYPTGNASEVLIENSTIKSTGAYGVGTNRAEGSNIKIVIKNSTIECRAGAAVFVNTSAEVIIEDSTIIGGVHGVVIRAGNAKISNTTIKATDPEASVFAYNNFANGYGWTPYWQGGNKIPAGALVIGCYASTDTYSGDATVELTNVMLESADTSDVPTVLMAASQTGKNATLTYDDASNVGDIKIYGDDWVGAATTFTHAGTITVNGTKMN